MKQSLHYHLEQLATERWTRHSIRTVLRACWMTVCVWCIALGGSLVWNWPLRLNALIVLSFGMIGAALILALRPRMKPREVAQRLDRRFHLDEQLMTAVELSRERPEEGSVGAYLVAESNRTIGVVRRRIQRQQAAPWSEVIALGAAAFVLLGLLVMVGIARPDGSLIGAALPPLPPLFQPQESTAPQEQQQQQEGGPQTPGEGQSPQQSGDPQVLGPIADALRDQGATRPAAEALDRGDVAGAAQDLRELADQAGQLSEQARSDLADNLREAANAIQERNSSLAEQLRQSADGLEQGATQAGQALDDLANALEQAQTPPGGDQGQQADQNGQQGGDQQGQQGQQGQGGDQQGGDQQGQQGQQGGNGQGQQQGGQDGQQAGGQGGNGNAQGEQRQSTSSSRIGVSGKPIELEAKGSGQRAENSGQQPASAEVVPGTTSGGGSNDVGTIGSDPLRVPVEDRDVVQGYFTP